MGEEFAVDSIKRGATDYVLKDRLARLPVTVQRALEEAKLRAQRREAEKILHEQSLFQASLLDSIPVPVFYKDRDGRYLGCNRAYEELLGVTRAEIIGKTVRDLAPPAIAEKYLTMDEELFAHPGRQVYEWIICRPSGEKRNVVFHKATFPHSDGSIGGLIGGMVDITELKRAEAELRIAATAFEAQEGMVITDAANVILRVNQAFTEITGYTAAEAVGRTPQLLKSGCHDAAFYAAMWHAIRDAGAWQGEIWNRRKNGEVYPEWLTITAVKDAGGAVSHYVGTLTDITSRKSAEEEIKNLAFFDPLTHLPNRRLLLDRLQQAVASSCRTGKLGALLFIDLDNFKTLNDTLGHDVGDLLLRQVAQRLAGGMREGDTVARLGGDEFVVMLEDLSDNAQEAANQTTVVAEKVQATLNQPYQVAGNEHYKEFLLHYQPQVDVAGRITGVEALVRWQHPVRGLLFPAEFICLAEETGLILPLGHWVLETGCAQLVAWAAQPDTAHLTLAVNVSARQFHRPDFVAQVLTVIERSGADPCKLKLELTESLLLEDVEDIIAKMTALKAHGIGFALDDFGTGYSSLSYLKRLPLDQMKIDRSFVRDILTDNNDAAIARTIVALARSMGLDVIAEGVETEAQRELLADHNCHAYQGYLFSQPVPAEQFESWLPAAASRPN
ncbi:MAG: EAL domain-containing protein [Rhodocyclales bacterium]|nr:EAL domain-containing protein [Rhodocyclales bacterium]